MKFLKKMKKKNWEGGLFIKKVCYDENIPLGVN